MRYVAAAIVVLVVSAHLPRALTAQSIHINGVVVSPSEIGAELVRYGIPMTTPIPPGRYWYDRVSGLWGHEGGPTVGQILPGLAVGGPLREDASGGGTGVWINRRELHVVEVVYLQQVFGYVIPGRYWLDAQGVGGPEGGPPLFNLAAAARAAGGGGGGGYHRRSLFGDTGSDGECFYYLHPGGSSVMNC